MDSICKLDNFFFNRLINLERERERERETEKLRSHTSGSSKILLIQITSDLAQTRRRDLLFESL